MSVLADLLAEVFREPTLAGVARELATLAAPLWLAALVGLLIGWAPQSSTSPGTNSKIGRASCRERV